MIKISQIINNINQLQVLERGKWCLICIDLDHLKAWNDCLGHPCADKLIKKIGDIMHRYVREVNEGKWIKKGYNPESFTQAFVYRFVYSVFVCEDKKSEK